MWFSPHPSNQSQEQPELPTVPLPPQVEPVDTTQVLTGTILPPGEPIPFFPAHTKGCKLLRKVTIVYEQIQYVSVWVKYLF